MTYLIHTLFHNKTVFLLTRPLRDVTWIIPLWDGRCAISTHTPLAGRDSKVFGYFRINNISTHTPLAGRDPAPELRFFVVFISTHTPLAGRDGRTAFSGVRRRVFLLTRPLRDVTLSHLVNGRSDVFLLTRPLRDVTIVRRNAVL